MARRSFSRCNRLPGVASALDPQPKIPSFIASSLVAPRSAMRRDAAIAQMASDMREAAHREGGLTGEGLELLGYSAKQIASLVRPARLIANKLAALT